jgi:RNA polymerase I-specific transcription initiation factor RRN3
MLNYFIRTRPVFSSRIKQGQSTEFNELIDQFNPSKQAEQKVGTFHPTQLRLWISALSHVVSRLERAHSALVHAVINMPWTVLDNVTVKAYTVFIGMLVSARPEYLTLVLSMIAQGFTYRELYIRIIGSSPC